MEDFIFSGSALMVTDLKYAKYYELLKKNTNLKTHETFFLTLLLGYTNNKKTSEYLPRGAEFRPSYFNADQKSIIYALAYDLYGEDLFKKMEEIEFQKDFKTALNLYSGGGMELLIEKIFKDSEINGQFNNRYNDYDLDILKLIYSEINKVPF